MDLLLVEVVTEEEEMAEMDLGTEEEEVTTIEEDATTNRLVGTGTDLRRREIVEDLLMVLDHRMVRPVEGLVVVVMAAEEEGWEVLRIDP